MLFCSSLNYATCFKFTFSMAFRAFYLGPGRDEHSALKFLIDKGVLSASETCALKRDGVECGSKMHIGNRKSDSGVETLV